MNSHSGTDRRGAAFVDSIAPDATGAWAEPTRSGLGRSCRWDTMTATGHDESTAEAARRLALARFDAGVARLAAQEEQRRARRNLWLSHHWPHQYGERCVTVAGRPVCRRCLALHPLAIVVAFVSAAGYAPWPASLDPWPIWLLSIPATAAYTAEALGIVRYHHRWQVATMLAAAFAFGRAMGYELLDRWHPWFWTPLIVFGAVWFWATLFASARRDADRTARQSAAIASIRSSSLL